MEKLISYILQFRHLNSQQIQLVKENVSTLELAKDEYFSEAGKIPNKIGFVIEGILRVCYYDREGNEVTRYFVEENNFAVDINSFNNQIPSTEYVQAIIPTKLLVFSKSSMQNLSDTIIDWDNIIAKITNKSLIAKINRISPMLAEDAKTRYLEFYKRFPGLVNRIPLNYLASYIGITKNSLSRIRNELNK
ncbi:Crp/Fnr family transcriptional regulator [Abyssalbus ytuae]|uniref:Crp/Fnr family transcriptional regulator n=1 Tax=Abyssalbus ytuae TaxID=2926907 RepID=A0A9E6ZVA7_9FLAO|nr:Crp/Fnr family transcriptional regulator [Abyssalbus ytuae]UOB17446.1 Crp/Fnr family transcriptional regulator [Abyssalbus ytuae]